MINKYYITHLLAQETDPKYYQDYGFYRFIKDCLTTSNETFIEAMEDLKAAGFDFKRVFWNKKPGALADNCILLVTAWPYFEDEERLRRIKYLVEECGVDINYECVFDGEPYTVLTTLAKCPEREESMRYLIDKGANTKISGFDVDAAIRGDYINPEYDLATLTGEEKIELLNYLHSNELEISHAEYVKKESEEYIGISSLNATGDKVFLSKYGYELVFKKGEWDSGYFTMPVEVEYARRLNEAVEANGGNLLSNEAYKRLYEKFKKEVIDPAPKKHGDVPRDEDYDYIASLEEDIFEGTPLSFEPNPIIDVLREYHKSRDVSDEAWDAVVDKVKSIIDDNPEIVRGETGAQAFICAYDTEVADIIVKEVIKRYGKEEALSILDEAYELTETPVRDIGVDIIENLAPMYKVIGSLYEEASKKAIDDEIINSLASSIEKTMGDNSHFAGTIDTLRANGLSQTEKLFDDCINGDRSSFSWSYDEDEE